MRVPSFLFLFTAETFGRKRETKMWVILFFSYSSSFLGSCLFFLLLSSSYRLFFLSFLGDWNMKENERNIDNSFIFYNKRSRTLKNPAKLF
jgi:hypothetical protein